MVTGAAIDPSEGPVAVEAAVDVSGRVREAVVLGVAFMVMMAAYLPRYLPPADAFSWWVSVLACLAVATYAFGLLVALRARSWLRRRGR